MEKIHRLVDQVHERRRMGLQNFIKLEPRFKILNRYTISYDLINLGH
jgi:hypothetical protein